MNLPKPTGGADYEGSLAFLKPTDLNKKGTTPITIIGNVRPGNSQFGEGINVDVKLGKLSRTFTIKFESGNYRRLYKICGANPDKWKGKKFNAQVGEYLQKKYVQVCD